MFDLDKALAELSLYKSYIAGICREVQLYEQLYCSADSRAVLNSNLTSVFGIIQRSMFVSLLTRVSAVLDSKAFGTDPNLSLAYFHDKYWDYIDDSLQAEFESVSRAYKMLNIKQFRNKLVAHNDLSTVMGDRSVAHTIKDGDIASLLNSARVFCINLSRKLPGGMDVVLAVDSWRLTLGHDGHELVRRLQERS